MTTAADDLDVVADAYVAGFPLMVSTRTLQVLGAMMGVNRLTWQPHLAGPRHRVIVAPNRDTLYSTAVCDLRSEPLVLALPEVHDRYFSYQLLDAWTESFAYVGTRTTGGRAGRWALVAPGWEGELPDDVERIDAPTPQVFLLGRFLVRDEHDVANVHAIGAESSLLPLSTVLGSDAPPPPPPLGDAPGAAQAVPTTAAAFAELARSLDVNPATIAVDRQAFAALEALGVPLATGADVSLEALDPGLVALLDEGAALGSQRIDQLRDGRGDLVNGWAVNHQIGTYGDDQVLRAHVARVGWGANVPEEALYPITRSDADGQPLDGRHVYRMRFPADGLPPVEAFWSLCAYGDDLFFTEHPSDRYHVGDQTPHLVHGDDGSVEVVLSHERP
ncbi:hypothetical protein B7486_53695, partial [cyanobacterium TDX16]